ncbi:MAG: alpha/beta hydrolase [Bacteroidetes bacterium]|nr:alpha/beta hydrolase [Bacteroidota bacterium]
MLISLLSLTFACAQQATFPRDSSYTLQSAYQKLHKKYPFIEPVEARLPEGVSSKEGLVYRKLGKRALHLDLYYPSQSANAQKYPGVVLIHGGGWRTGDKSLVIPMAQQLAARGYVTATVEYRLSLEAPYPAAVNDIKAAIRWLRAQAGELPLDTSKIAVYGTSAGGQLAALIGTTNGLEEMEGAGDYAKHSSAVQAIVDVDGILAFKHPESEEGSMAAQWLGGSYEEVPGNWKEASALTHVGENTPPTLFISSSFPRFHAGKADMIKVLEAEHVYYESYSVPDTPHSFWLFHPWFKPTLQYTADFLDRVFKHEEGR